MSLSQLLRSKRSHLSPQQAVQPCLQCTAFIRQFFTETRPSPNWFRFVHGSFGQRQKSANAGCPVCDFAIRNSEEDRVVEINGSLNQQATIFWNSAFEFFEPGMLASTQELARLDESHQAGYPPPEWENAYDLQRDVPARTDDPACFELVRIWVQKCCNKHPNCSRPTVTKLPTRVIYVGTDGTNPFLLETNGEMGLYVALSYRWGTDLSFVTNTENLENRKSGIALQTLPATFRDAVVLCRKVGMKFLWIDAICIIQGSPEDWDREAGRMASIYRQAVFTISALHASSSQDGLFCERVKLSSVTFSSPLREHGKISEIGMRVASPTFSQEMEDSPLTSRGWIYQERALSTATLHFTRYQIIWECRNKIISEYSSQIHGFSSASALTLDFGRSIARLRPQPGLLHADENAMREWETVVECFSRTRFTVATDRLPAICGVGALFKDSITDPENILVAGLWSSFLYRQLLWIYDERDEASMLGPPMKNLVWVPPGWKHRLPSWSWISVDYPVRTWAADQMPFHFRVTNIQRAHPVTFASYLNGSASLVLQVWGGLQWFDAPVQQLDKPKPVEIALKTGTGPPLTRLKVTLDPGCSIPKYIVGMIVAESPFGTVAPIPRQTYFLILQPTERPESGFRRIGIGSGPQDAVEMAFIGATFREISLL